MAEPAIGISFMPSADAAANGPKQGAIEGQGGSDLAAAFKILSLHLPRVLGAASIAPKRLLTSQGSAGVMAPAGVSPYAQVFQALLQSISGGMNPPGGGDVQSLASLFGGYSPSGDLGTSGVPPVGGGGGTPGGGYTPSGAPPPAVIPGGDGRDNTTPPPPPTPTANNGGWMPEDRGDTYSTRYL